jgi:hypothetical protein
MRGGASLMMVHLAKRTHSFSLSSGSFSLRSQVFRKAHPVITGGINAF